MTAQASTSWILNIVDKMTKPMVNIDRSVKKMTAGIDAMTTAVKFSEKDVKEALLKSKNHYKDLQGTVKGLEKELALLEAAYKKAKPGTEQAKAKHAFDQAKQKVERYRKQIQEAELDVKDLTGQVEKFNNKNKDWTHLATGINQGIELLRKATSGLDFAVDIQKLQSEIERFTDLSGDDLDNFVAKSRKIGKTYREDALNIARAANAMTKQVGGSFESNLELIEQGFQKGANANGDFIDQLKEYQPFIKQLGITQSQAIALMAQAGKKGIYSDKALDSLKEANISLREMGKIQKTALEGIGLSPEDLVGKTSFEAIKLISLKMKDATTQAKELILKDIFKGAGEDAGLAWAAELSEMDLDISKLKNVQEAGAGIRGWFSDISTSIGQVTGSIATYVQELSPVIGALASSVLMFKSLNKVVWLQTAATKALTAVQNLFNLSNPIGWITILIGLVATAIAYYDKWGASFLLILGPLGWVINLVQSFRRNWDSIVEAFKSEGILSGIKRIGVVILDALLMPLQQLLELLSKIPGMGFLAGGAASWIKKQRDNLNLITPEKKKEEDKTPSVNDYLTKPASLLSFNPDNKKTKQEKEGLGLNVGNGGGIKSIVMTINNHFDVSKASDVRSIVDRVVVELSDKMRDGLINIG